jgi:hypothetical protein
VRIERLLAAGASIRGAARKFDIDYHSLRRHWTNHVSAEARASYVTGAGATKDQLEQFVADESLGLINHYRIVRGALYKGFTAAVELGDGNFQGVLAGRLHENFRDCRRLTGELQRGPLLNIQNNALVKQLRGLSAPWRHIRRGRRGCGTARSGRRQRGCARAFGWSQGGSRREWLIDSDALEASWPAIARPVVGEGVRSSSRYLCPQQYTQKNRLPFSDGDNIDLDRITVRRTGVFVDAGFAPAAEQSARLAPFCRASRVGRSDRRMAHHRGVSGFLSRRFDRAQAVVF